VVRWPRLEGKVPSYERRYLWRDGRMIRLHRSSKSFIWNKLYKREEG
jgi:hypothetical protein